MKKILLSLLLFLASEFAFAQYDSLEADSVAGELDYTARFAGSILELILKQQRLFLKTNSVGNLHTQKIMN